MVVELSYVPEPDREQILKCVEKKRAYGALFIENPNRLADYVAWQCKRLWLTPLWRAWGDKLKDNCNINYKDFMHIASHAYPAEWLLGRMSWRDFLSRLVEILNRKCKINFHLQE